MSIEDKIKSIAHNVSEGYLIFGKDVNDKISDMYASGEIENKEILKRVCELVNQNIYLSLFNDSSVDNASIKFDYADYNSISNDISESGEYMDHYKLPPEDFRFEHDAEMSKQASLETEKTASEFNTIEAIHSANEYMNKISQLSSVFKTIEVSYVKQAEQSYINLKDTVKKMSLNGDTIDDMKKLAERYTNDCGIETEKVASAFNLIEKELELDGYKVNKGLTKTASMPIDMDSEYFDGIYKLAESIEAISAAKDVSSSLDSILNYLKEE